MPERDPAALLARTGECPVCVPHPIHAPNACRICGDCPGPPSAVEAALARCAAAQAAYLAAVQERRDAVAAAVRVRATYTEIAAHTGLSRGFAHRLAEQGADHV